MAVAGRKPKPYNLKVIEGNPGHKPLKKPIEIDKKKPACPKWLDEIARKEWKRISDALYESGLLTSVDMTALAMYCLNFSIVRQINTEIKRMGGVVKYLKGKNSQTNMLHVALNKAMLMIKNFCAEFGLTPSSRGRINLNPIGESDDWDGLLD